MTIPSFSHAPIDIHSHFNHGSPFDWRLPDNPLHLRDLDFVLEEQRNVGIACGGFSTYASVLEHPECIVEENEYLHRLAGEDARIFQWVVIDPRLPETFCQAERMLPCKKTLGIKIHASHGYDIEEYADRIFSFVNEQRAVLLMHPQKVEKMASFANRYPDMKLIIAHLSSMEHIAAIREARYGNIYTDTSGGASNLNNVIEYAVNQVGSEKILFGTDAYACSFQFGRIALARLPHADKENILYKNAVKMFPNAFGEDV
ncbi:MAG: amidohydrolase [Clostridia bacterium]|nr:amidohydrolase [Clostridia bacterium]